MTGNYQVEPSELRSAAKKIKDAAGDSDKVKLGEAKDSVGDFGHDAASTSFSRLMSTWEKAVSEPLKGDAEASAEKLEDTATSYEQAETDSSHYFQPPGGQYPGFAQPGFNQPGVGPYSPMPRVL
ncbi:WXG100 family type VII secretion target [Streptomyces sp. HNM0574]|uniref:WXG100 family type VII secretion target n=1 Tax=Streptomyces sp. HNM0574 TaxID=2714954 RepID=UPI001469CCFC|nr:WXG100 family type VII secretion target [Streptomyces sp. HNM0574]NLU66524.1 hypothetical protein [Streptomyces sp. HNM0574]